MGVICFTPSWGHTFQREGANSIRRAAWDHHRESKRAPLILTLTEEIATPGEGSGFGMGNDGLPFRLLDDRPSHVFVAERESQRIRKIDTDGFVTTLAGSGNGGYRDGVGIFTAFNNPRGIVADAVGNVYVGDDGNHLIRRITPEGSVSTFAGTFARGGYQEGIGTNTVLNSLESLAIDKLGNI